METNVLIGCIAALAGIIFSYLTMLSRIKGDTKKDGIESGQLKADIDYIKRRSDDTLIELRGLNKTVSDHADRLARVEESAKQAHHRINELREEMGKDAASKV